MRYYLTAIYYTGETRHDKIESATIAKMVDAEKVAHRWYRKLIIAGDAHIQIQIRDINDAIVKTLGVK